MGKGTEKLCKFYCFDLSKSHDVESLAVNYTLQEANCVTFLSWIRQLVTETYLPYLQYYPCPHFIGLTACFLSLFLSLGETKKDDSVKGYDESSPRIFMARPTPSRAASCSPCVHQYKTDNVQLMQRHVVQMHTHDFWM